VNPLVLTKDARVSKRLRTEGARVRSLTRVGAVVRLERARRQKALAARLTDVGPFTRVVPDVPLQSPDLAEALAAPDALERRLLRVKLDVQTKALDARELVAADAAQRRRASVVSLAMDCHRRRLSKASLADVAFIRFLTGMYATVFLKVVRIRKFLIAHATGVRLFARVKANMAVT